jgi:hypothetical protein
MRFALQQKTTLIWLGLVLATGLSWQFGHGFGFGDNIHYATTAVISISFLKVRFIMLDFMEVRTAPKTLRIMLDTWVALVCTILIVLYWSGT